MQERAADITSFIGETLSGIHIVKAFNREETEITRFEKTNKGVFDYFKKTNYNCALRYARIRLSNVCYESKYYLLKRLSTCIINFFLSRT